MLQWKILKGINMDKDKDRFNNQEHLRIEEGKPISNWILQNARWLKSEDINFNNGFTSNRFNVFS